MDESIRDHDGSAQTVPQEKDSTDPVSMEERETSRVATGRFGEEEVSYTAKAATLVFEINEAMVSFFYVAYTRNDVDPEDRPVVFCFNGGPGSSTVWLHLGLFGPKRMALDEEGFASDVPGRLVENVHSILDVSDVVCIDAIGTGLSRATPEDKERDFHHFRHDVEAFSQFIVRWLDRHGRWQSPKYLAGESYGTFRAAAVGRELFHTHGLQLNGLILISTILNYQTVAIDRETKLAHPGNDLPFALYLPTYAATAWYHDRLPSRLQKKDLPTVVEEVEEFALGEYWTALAQGDRLDQKTRSRILAKLSEYTGLDTEYLDHYDLRVHIVRFCKELLRDRRRTVGRIDSRHLGIDRVSRGEVLEADPSIDTTTPVATATLNHYLRQEIGFDATDIYKVSSTEIWERWDYEAFKNRYADTSEDLRDLLSRSSATSVFIASGYYDLATPHFATEYTLAHMGLDPEVRARIRVERYEAGHMMYLHEDSLAKLAAHLRGLVRKTA